MTDDILAKVGGGSTPSLSWKDAPIGTSHTGTITKELDLVQARDFDSGDPLYWPAVGRGKPTTTPGGKEVMSVVFAATWDTVNGEERSVWARQPSAMLTALNKARVAFGRAPGPGDKVRLTLVDEKANPDNPRLHPQKIYEAEFSAGPPADVLTTAAEAPASPAPAAQAPQPPSVPPAPQASPPAAPQPVASPDGQMDAAALMAALGNVDTASLPPAVRNALGVQAG